MTIAKKKVVLSSLCVLGFLIAGVPIIGFFDWKYIFIIYPLVSVAGGVYVCGSLDKGVMWSWWMWLLSSLACYFFADFLQDVMDRTASVFKFTMEIRQLTKGGLEQVVTPFINDFASNSSYHTVAMLAATLFTLNVILGWTFLNNVIKRGGTLLKTTSEEQPLV